ncbi:MAG TPA: twin-arginine translocase subunit TatC [Gaiellaceae bacterium]|jgi:sec-independent protein translocase protein TatC|nr:twin-arginine translocase subunit TatC [Gaiellaceae bacterium]
MRPRRLDREEEATLVEHLDELRGRLMVALAAVGVATAVAFVFHNTILDLLARPLPPGHRHVAAFGVTEPFSVSVAVSLYAGILFALPVLLWQSWSFLAPALDSAAERRILLLSVFGLVLGAAGLAFGYGILLPRAVHWLTSFDTTHFRLLVRASSYYSFVVTVLLGIVCIFETPLVVLALVNLGVLTSASLRRNRRKGYFIVSVIALALPGPDPVTTLLELLPMLALFEGSIWLAAFSERRAARMQPAGAQA